MFESFFARFTQVIPRVKADDDEELVDPQQVLRRTMHEVRIQEIPKETYENEDPFDPIPPTPEPVTNDPSKNTKSGTVLENVKQPELVKLLACKTDSNESDSGGAGGSGSGGAGGSGSGGAGGSGGSGGTAGSSSGKGGSGGTAGSSSGGAGGSGKGGSGSGSGGSGSGGDDTESDSLIDPMDTLRAKCREQPNAVSLAKKLEECNERVSSKNQTAETCVEELFDLLHAIDHCVTPKLFPQLK